MAATVMALSGKTCSHCENGALAVMARRRQHHRQLRRCQQAPYCDRRRRARGQKLRTGGTGHPWRRWHGGRQVGDHARHAGRRTVGGTRQAGHDARLAAAEEVGEVRSLLPLLSAEGKGQCSLRARNSTSSVQKSSVRSRCNAWAHEGNMANDARGMPRQSISVWDQPYVRSRSPQMIKVG